MNVDGSESVLNSHICFNALATLQNIKNVENSCNFCSSSDHATYLCPVLSKGEHVKDTSTDNLSWSSVPHGLQVYQDEGGSHIISVQKFARGSRFGPLMAPKSYIPIENTKFPLKIFGAVNFDMDAMQMAELRDLFKVRHIHLDTRNEKYCNWMIHVDPAQYSNEQNLIAYEEDNEIFFAAIEDLDVGDILKVWYAPKYGECMKMPALCESGFPIVKNVLNRSGGVLLPEIQLFNNYSSYDQEPNRTEIMLPSIKTIIKPSSYVCYESHPYHLTAAAPSYYSVSSPTNTYNSMIDQTTFSETSNYASNSSILNLDDTFSTETEFNDMMSCDDDPDKMDKLLIASGDSNATDSQRLEAGGSGGITQNGGCIEKDEKKMYPCRLCDKKYSTMTNIYRHVRATHSCFLCSLCMKIFNHEAELKEHISKCPKFDFKKPQCGVCMQYFSNTWSLTRHIKIHVSAGECDPNMLVEKKVKDLKKSKDDSKENFDLSDIEKNSQDGFLLGIMGAMPETQSFESDLCSFDGSMPTIKEATANLQAVCIDKMEPNISVEQPPAPPPPSAAPPIEKDNEISSCVVCDKKFKSKSCMNKHLRSVHAVRILSGVKRSTSNHGHKNSTKRSYLSESQSSITHTGSPVNPMTAKALASKLNERNNLLNGTKKVTVGGGGGGQSTAFAPSNGTANDIPVPPLISIQTTSSTAAANRFKDATDIQCRDAATTQKHKFVPSKHVNAQSSANFKPFTEAKQHKCSTSSKQSNGTNSTHHTKAAKVSSNQLLSSPKMHKCDFCAKKFNKKYELKRHRTVHENITFTCPFCEKVVKRKPSLIKHLRIQHKEKEPIWSNSEFIAQIKGHTKQTAEGFMPSESSNTNESSTDERSQMPLKKASSAMGSSIDHNGDNGEIYKNVFLSGDDAKTSTTTTTSTTISAAHTISSATHHHHHHQHHASEDDEMSLLDATTATVDDHRKQSVVNMTTQASLNTIIDDCFFGEDALNCNVVLVHSPFSSDNDVDGFTMNNENGDCVMNKELLNKFHDRLEEMEEKADSNDFKTIWDHVLDEDNLNDDICTDDIDESVVV